MNQNNQPDELDIELFASRLYRVLGKILRKLFYPVKLLAYNPMMLVINLVVVVAVAGILYKVLPPVYEASFIIKPLNKTDNFFIGQVDDIKQLVKDKDARVLASELGIPESYTAAWKNLSAKVVWKGKDKDTISLVIFEIRASDSAIFDEVQNSLIRYFENNPHYMRLKSLRKVDINSLRLKLAGDMHEIDSVKLLMTQTMGPRNSGGFVFGEPMDPVKLYQEGLSLYHQSLNLNWQMEFIDNFELVKPCIAASKPVWPRLSYLAGAFIALALFITMYINQKKISAA